MGQYDRDWYRGGQPPPANPMARSFHIARVAGINIDVHILFIVFTVVELLQAALRHQFPFQVRVLTVLWVTVLLHEFGHCFGARHVGGSANRILLWPLGGLAYTDPPKRPGAQLFTTAAGPAVNLLLMILIGAALVAITGDWRALPIHPLRPMTPWDWPAGADFGELELWLLIGWGVNYSLFLFNLLPVWPLDGGRMLQEILWYRIGWYRSMQRAMTVGMFGAVCMGVWGLVGGNWMFIGIAVMCYIECLQQQHYLSAHPPEPWQEAVEAEEEAIKESLVREKPPRKPWFWERDRIAEEKKEDELVDGILEKIHRDGIGSLSDRERTILKNATERRKRNG